MILRAVFGVEDAERRGQLRDGLVEILGATASPVAVGLIAPGTSAAADVPAPERAASAPTRCSTWRSPMTPRLGEDARDDILSLLVTAGLEDGSAMDDTEFRDQLMTLLLAGTRRRAVTGLAWASTCSCTTWRRSSGCGPSSRRASTVISMWWSTSRCACAPWSRSPDASSARRPSSAATSRRPHRGHGRNLSAHPRRRLCRAVRAFRPERFLATMRQRPSPGFEAARGAASAAFAQFEMRLVIETVLRSVRLRTASSSLERPVRRNVTLSRPTGRGC